jgi:hypothetical protein
MHHGYTYSPFLSRCLIMEFTILYDSMGHKPFGIYRIVKCLKKLKSSQLFLMSTPYYLPVKSGKPCHRTRTFYDLNVHTLPVPR